LDVPPGKIGNPLWAVEQSFLPRKPLLPENCQAALKLFQTARRSPRAAQQFHFKSVTGESSPVKFKLKYSDLTLKPVNLPFKSAYFDFKPAHLKLKCPHGRLNYPD
jgi:hypothetical protein